MNEYRISKKRIITCSLVILLIVGGIVSFLVLTHKSPEERVEEQIDKYIAYIDDGCINSDAYTGRGGTTNINTLNNDRQTCMQAEKYLQEHLYGHDKIIKGTMKCISDEYVLEDEFWGASFSRDLDYEFLQVVDGSISEFYVTDDSGNISKLDFIDNIEEHFKITEQKEVKPDNTY